MTAPSIRRRICGDLAALPATLNPVLRRAYASRGIVRPEELGLELAALLHPDLLGIDAACAVLADAIRDGRRIVVVGDYDADGATGTALAVAALRGFGAPHVDFLIPSRFRQGYGLSAELAQAAAAMGAQVLVTVDNGIAALAGVAAARALGMQVVVTDHHLAGDELPAADAVVNPNQRGCGFASKHLAGVGVVFYVMSALRAHLRRTGWFNGRPEPRLSEYLDLVAVGTVADVVRLDRNNRILVAQGLARIRAGHARPGIRALLQVAGRAERDIAAGDLGFSVGPRLNAAGRLEDMRLGIECLLAGSLEQARPLAEQLDRINRSRRDIEAQMRDDALAMTDGFDGARVGVCLFDAHWHEGVVGLVASRIKDRIHRPVIAFARGQQAGILKGSARSIPGLHVRDALALLDARTPGLMLRFGGHAMAAGLTLAEDRLAEFSEAFDAACRQFTDPLALQQIVETDGELVDGELCLDTAFALERGGPWGQGFPEPLFDGSFDVEQARLVGERHVRYRLRTAGGQAVDAIDFGGVERMARQGRVHATYLLAVNRWQGQESFELRLEYLGAC